MANNKPRYKQNRKGYTVVNDGRSNVTNAAGRPPKQRQMYMKHIAKVYADKSFTSYDIMKSLSLQISGDNASSKIVRVGMQLRSLEKLGYIKCTGIVDNNQRGNNVKQYVLCK